MDVMASIWSSRRHTTRAGCFAVVSTRYLLLHVGDFGRRAPRQSQVRLHCSWILKQFLDQGSHASNSPWRTRKQSKAIQSCRLIYYQSTDLSYMPTPDTECVKITQPEILALTVQNLYSIRYRLSAHAGTEGSSLRVECIEQIHRIYSSEYGETSG